jgi:prepilin-type N-terminal cleavage/methylation domain-containing protein
MKANPSRTGAWPRPGFTLVEMSLVLAGLGLLLLIGTAILIGAVRMERANAVAQRRLTDRAALAEQFRDDVGGADATPERVGKLTAGPTCLILRRADGGHVVYRWHAGRLERSEPASPGASRPPRAVGPEFVGVEFKREGAGHGLVTLSLSEPGEFGGPVQPFVLSAALAGDQR